MCRLWRPPVTSGHEAACMTLRRFTAPLAGGRSAAGRCAAPAAGRQDQATRPPCSPGSTRSPAGSSPSTSRSTRRCSSARCRSRRASATPARRPKRRGPTRSSRSTRSTLKGDEAHLHRLDVRRQPRPHAIEHPVYDIWLTDCKGGKGTEPPPTPVVEAKPDAKPDAKAKAKKAAPPADAASPDGTDDYDAPLDPSLPVD